MSKEEWQADLEETGCKDAADLEAEVKRVGNDIAKRRKREGMEVQADLRNEEEPTFSLIDTPDDQVSLYI